MLLLNLPSHKKKMCIQTIVTQSRTINVIKIKIIFNLNKTMNHFRSFKKDGKYKRKKKLL